MKINPLPALILLPAGLLADTAPDIARTARDTLGAFVGAWNMELMAEKATFGDRGGAGTGTMTCAWGPMEAWVDCELDSRYAGLGQYVLKIVLYRTGREDTYGAFVTNSFGGGRLYLGKWESANELVYRDAWTNPARNWEHQRVTYTFRGDGGLSYAIDVSHDGETYLPHSSGVYHRK